jgi:RNA polymerase sigma-70 factor (ECF subfamily)
MSAPSKPLALGLLVGEFVPSGADGPALAAADGVRERRLEGWFRDHFDMLWRLAARLGVPHASVDDVVQEAFITADRRAADIGAGAERRFLISTTVRLCANQRRRREARREQPMPTDLAAVEGTDAEQLLARKRLREWLELALDALPHEQRTVFVLHELEGFAIGEIATLIDRPAGTVASRLARSRNQFSKMAARLRARWTEHEAKGEGA